MSFVCRKSDMGETGQEKSSSRSSFVSKGDHLREKMMANTCSVQIVVIKFQPIPAQAIAVTKRFAERSIPSCSPTIVQPVVIGVGVAVAVAVVSFGLSCSLTSS